MTKKVKTALSAVENGVSMGGEENKKEAPQRASDEPTDPNVGSGTFAVPEKTPELQPKPVSEKLSLEDQIEAWREQANEVVTTLNKNTSNQIDGARENLWRKLADKLNSLLVKWGQENSTTGYKVLIERRGCDSKGFLVVGCSKATSDGLSMDLEKAISQYGAEDIDTLIDVTSSTGEYTKVAKILASTVAGFAVQTHTIYGQYVPKKALEPLDSILERAGIGQSEPKTNNASLNR